MNKARSLLLAVIFLLTLSGFAQNVQQALKSECEGKVLTLRHPYKSNSQRYDASGHAINGGEEGTWTMYGRIVVEKVEIKANKIELRGVRVLYLYNKDAKQFAGERSHTIEVKIEIETGGSPDSLPAALAILDTVFARTQADLVNSAPDFWRGYLEKENKPSAPQITSLHALQDRQGNNQSMDGGQKVYGIGRGVTPPKRVYTPEPEFSEEARKASYEGVVVLRVVIDQTGKVTSANIFMPAGLGLDENAVRTVKTWTFEPALRNGEPVPVEMTVEVAFNFYHNHR